MSPKNETENTQLGFWVFDTQIRKRQTKISAIFLASLIQFLCCASIFVAVFYTCPLSDPPSYAVSPQSVFEGSSKNENRQSENRSINSAAFQDHWNSTHNTCQIVFDHPTPGTHVSESFSNAYQEFYRTPGTGNAGCPSFSLSEAEILYGTEFGRLSNTILNMVPKSEALC